MENRTEVRDFLTSRQAHGSSTSPNTPTCSTSHAQPTLATANAGPLPTRSEEFRTWWASHNVGFHCTSTKQMHHPWQAHLS